MRARLIGAIAGILALGIAVPAATVAQTPPPPPTASSFSAPQLDQLVAPIALYPDELLGQILMAATYPLEVVEAERWVQDPSNAALQGDGLASALAAQDWDPSVKALVPFPRVLQMMNDRLDWMQKLGDAFLGQQGDVMDAVQRLRAEAQAAGTLASTPQQAVTSDGQAIAIEPTNPGVIYPPYYDPTIVYGAWPDPDYPPFYFPPPPDYAVGPPLFFGIGIAVVPVLWGWDRFEWRDHRVHIDVDRFNRIDRDESARRRRPPVSQDTWQHDPSHRHGVAYRDPAAQTKFAKPMPGSPDQRRPYRGYDTAVGTPTGTPAPGPRGRGGTPDRAQGARQPAAVAPPPPVVRQPDQTRLPTATRPPSPAIQPPVQTRLPTATRPPPPAIQPPVQARLPTATRPPSAPVIQPAAQTRLPTIMRGSPPTAARAAPPAFEGFARGQDVRSQAARGQQSLQAPVAVRAAPAPHVTPQASKPSGGGGGPRGKNAR